MAREVAAGGIGAAMVDSLFNPAEVIKVRMQIESQRPTSSISAPSTASSSSRQYVSFLQSGAKIYADDGVVGLFQPGLVATWFRALVYTGLRIGLYPSIKGMLMTEEEANKPPLFKKIMAGALTGAIGSAIANPTDLVRIRFQGESGTIVDGKYTTGLMRGSPPSYPHTFAAFAGIARTEGVAAGLYRGVDACVARAVFLSGSQLAAYDHTKELMRESGVMSEGPALHFFASACSAIIAQTVAMPADTIKTRVMNDRSSSSSSKRQYKSMVDCFVKTVKSEGAIGLFRGYIPACARQCPVMIVQMPLIEQLRGLMGLGYF